MEKATVYFTDMRARPGLNLQQKLEKLMRRAGIEQIDFQDKFTAIKIHFGEPGNLSYLRPNFAKTVADVVESLGGKPFLTDCNTLYVGRRKNALDHMDAAYENGFSPFSTGCHVIIADGLKGTDEVEVPVQGGEYVKSAKIGRAVMDADVFISLAHFKGHESTGFGGAIKNVGMGCGSRAGKMEMHCGGKPSVDQELCRGCHMCARNCAHDAISFDENRKASIDHNKCVGCGRCIGACNFDAIANNNYHANDELNCKMAEYAKAVVDGRFLHQHCQPGVAQLRLPRRKRRGHHSGRGHVRQLRPGGAGRGLCRCLQPDARSARQPAVRKPAPGGRLRSARPLLQQRTRHQLEKLCGARRENRPGHPQL